MASVATDSFSGNIADLKQAILSDGAGNQVQICSIALECGQVRLQNPLDTDIRDGRVRIMTALQSRLILKDCQQLVVAQDLPNHCHVYVAFLKGLVARAARPDIPSTFDKGLDALNFG